MASIMRLSQPWVYSPLRSRAPSPILSSFYRSFSVTAPQPYAVKSKSARRLKTPSRKNEIVQREANMTLLIPHTLIAPPLWRYPRHPSKFFKMMWIHIKARFQSIWAIISMKMVSQPNILVSRPRFKFHKSSVVPTAKALHVRMSEAMAAGDKETLRSICTPELFETLAATIDSRPHGVRASWELVRYTYPLRYPRIADWRVGYQPLSNNDMKIVKQVVVSIASVQRIARYDDTANGAMIPGSERTRQMIEHIVMQATVEKDTYINGPWKIWGTLPESTYEEYLAELENIEALMADQAKSHS